MRTKRIKVSFYMVHDLDPIGESKNTLQGSNLTFLKYHGKGNDFIIFDMAKDGFSLPWYIDNAKRLCDRHHGIGADGIILLMHYQDHYRMTMINADGSLANNCGNGL